MSIQGGPEMGGFGNPSERNQKQEKNLPFGAVEQSLEKYFKKNKIEVPLIEMTILFTRHHSDEDAAWMEQYYKEADIFIPEAEGWTEDSIQFYQKIADGKMSASTEHPFTRMMYSIMYRNPGKKITFIDVQGETRKRDNMEIERAILAKERRAIVVKKLPYEEAVEKNYKILKEGTSSDDYRERKMIAELPVQIARLLKEYPELKEKKNLKIVLLLGSIHTRVYHWLKQRGEHVDRKFQEMPKMYTSDAVIARAEIFKKNSSITEKSKEEAFFLSLLAQNTFLRKTLDLITADEFNNYANFILKNISHSEMKNLYGMLINGENNNKFQKGFEDLLKSKHVPIIKTVSDAEKVRNWVLEEDTKK